ncbi:MAG: leucine-rich repeat protein, partial [Clostridiales bacterium]|nr:leucine-rich repeat protein [Clostridiales bacterium]
MIKKFIGNREITWVTVAVLELIIIVWCLNLNNGGSALYTVRFDPNGGSGTYSEEQSVEAGQKAENPGTPVRDGYDFSGWWTARSGGERWDFAVNTVTGDMTLYARWDIAYYTVEFDSNGGNAEYEEQRVAHGQKAIDPGAPEIESFDFSGWWTAKSGGERWDFETDIVTENVTLYACYTEIPKYTVTFNANGGSPSVQTQSIMKGEKVSYISTPTKSGYAFVGWYTMSTYGEYSKYWDLATDTVTQSVTLYAWWGTAGLAYGATIDGEREASCGSASGDYISIPAMYFGKRVTAIAQSGFIASFSMFIEIPSSVTSIGDNAFNNCYFLASIEIPNSVTSIGINAFSGCASLTYIKLSDSLTGIGDGMFSACQSLAEIELPDSVTSIGKDAFRNCPNLTDIKLPDSLISIGANAFYQCSKLSSIEIPSKVTTIGDYAFIQCNLTGIELPDSVESIGASAFYYCLNLTTVTISSSSNLTVIGYGAFFGCSELTEILIPDSVESIGGRAFWICSKLTTVTIGPSSKLKSIGA